MRRLIGLAALMAAAFLSSNANAADLRIGVVAPLTGPSARLGAQVRVGAEAAAGTANPAPALDLVDDGCSADGGTAAANKLVADKVDVVVGFLCTESIEA